jgi:hypothetical protein
VTQDRDGVLLCIAAELMMAHYGADAAGITRERADLAEAMGDLRSADAWREVAHAIEALQAP